MAVAGTLMSQLQAEISLQWYTLASETGLHGLQGVRGLCCFPGTMHRLRELV